MVGLAYLSGMLMILLVGVMVNPTKPSGLNSLAASASLDSTTGKLSSSPVSNIAVLDENNLVRNGSFEMPITRTLSSVVVGNNPQLGWNVEWTTRGGRTGSANRLAGVEILSGYKDWQANDGAQFPNEDAPKVNLPEHVGLIMVRVQADWYDPQKDLDTSADIYNNALLYPEATIDNVTRYGLKDINNNPVTAISAFVKSTIANLRAGSIDSQEITTSKLTSKGLTIKNGQGETVVNFDGEGNAFFSGTLTADVIKANKIEGLEILTNKISALSAQNVALENVLATSSGSFNYDEFGIVSGTEGLSVTKPIVFEHQGLFKALAEFIDKVTFRSDVAVLGRATFNKDTGGFAQIKKGSRRVNVTFEREYEQIPVITANLIWNTDDSDLKLVDTNDAYFLAKPDYVIGNVTTKGFSIITSERVVRDLRRKSRSTIPKNGCSGSS
jgi:hypothetical protein